VFTGAVTTQATASVQQVDDTASGQLATTCTQIQEKHKNADQEIAEKLGGIVKKAAEELCKKLASAVVVPTGVTKAAEEMKASAIDVEKKLMEAVGRIESKVTSVSAGGAAGGEAVDKRTLVGGVKEATEIILWIMYEHFKDLHSWARPKPLDKKAFGPYSPYRPK
jgi:hypothetical protein